MNTAKLKEYYGVMLHNQLMNIRDDVLFLYDVFYVIESTKQVQLNYDNRECRDANNVNSEIVSLRKKINSISKEALNHCFDSDGLEVFFAKSEIKYKSIKFPVRENIVIQMKRIINEWNIHLSYEPNSELVAIVAAITAMLNNDSLSPEGISKDLCRQ